MSNRRREDRAISTFKGAYVRTGSGLHFVTMRNMSDTGVCFDGLADLAIGERIECCFDTSGPRMGEVKWIGEDQFGVALEERQDGDLAFPPRSVRLPLATRASLFLAGERFLVTVHNISLRGACISGAPQIETGRLVSMDIANRTFDLATVRWSGAARTGIRFAQPVPMAEFREHIDRLGAAAATAERKSGPSQGVEHETGSDGSSAFRAARSARA